MPEITATFFFMGTGHEVGRQFGTNRHDHLFTALQRLLAGAPPIYAGPGAPQGAPGGYGKARGIGFGTGWQDNVNATLAALTARQAEAPPLQGINLVGHSRGAVTCIMVAHALAADANFRAIPVNIFAIDPVPGGYSDFVSLSLPGNPYELPANVRDYTSILMENAGTPFFACLAEGHNLRSLGAGTRITQYPMPGKHGDAVKTDTNAYPLSRISAHLVASFLLDNRSPANLMIIDLLRDDDELVEDYAIVALDRLERGKSKGAAASWLVSRWLVPPLWRNDRSRLVRNDYRAHPFYVNAHHAGLFNGCCGLIAQRIARHNWIGRGDFERFSQRFPRTYDLLEQTGFARSLDDPATMTPADRFVFALGDLNIHELEVRPASASMRPLCAALETQISTAVARTNVPNTLGAGRVFSPEDWTRATRVTFGARGDQVAIIDRLLPAFHAYAGRGNIGAALRIACWMAEQAEEHLRTKPTSNRRTGMVQLAKQLYQLLPTA
jgi:hypothetical protein